MSYINWGHESPEQIALRKRLDDQALLEQAMYMAAMAAAAGSGGLIGKQPFVYLRTSESEPWENTDNVDELNAVFGEKGWTLRFFETVDASEIFNESTTYIFMEGSDNGTEELTAFLSQNQQLIEDWVYAGGNLFLNAAPNEGSNFGIGFGGVALQDGYESTNATIADGQSAHPIFVGPGSCGTDWTGDSFAHAIIDGPATPLIINPGQLSVCSELVWGSGKAIFGTMTITGYQQPKPQVIYLRQNIHAYLSGVTYSLQLGLRSLSNNSELNATEKSKKEQ
jgi:hypothetical protein